LNYGIQDVKTNRGYITHFLLFRAVEPMVIALCITRSPINRTVEEGQEILNKCSWAVS